MEHPRFAPIIRAGIDQPGMLLCDGYKTASLRSTEIRLCDSATLPVVERSRNDRSPAGNCATLRRPLCFLFFISNLKRAIYLYCSLYLCVFTYLKRATWRTRSSSRGTREGDISCRGTRRRQRTRRLRTFSYFERCHLLAAPSSPAVAPSLSGTSCPSCLCGENRGPIQ